MWAIVVLTSAVAGLGALLGAALGLVAHGLPYGGCSGFYPATCEYAFRAGAAIGALGGLSIAGALAWPISGRRRRVAMLASGACAILAIPTATYVVARTDPTNHATDLSRMVVWVASIAVATAVLAWIVAFALSRTATTPSHPPT